MEITLTMYARCWGAGSQTEAIQALDVLLTFYTIEEFVAWLERRHLKGAIPEGDIDLGQVRREANEIFARFRRKEEAESARSAGRKRRVRKPRSGQAEDPDLPPPGSKP
jgi:hypothetical protein